MIFKGILIGLIFGVVLSMFGILVFIRAVPI